jgi:hypothetical protein
LNVEFGPTVSPGSTTADVLVLLLLGALAGRYANNQTSSEAARAARTTRTPTVVGGLLRIGAIEAHYRFSSDLHA